MTNPTPQNKEAVNTAQQETTSVNKPKRNKKGQLLPGNTANKSGAPILTPEQKLDKKAEKIALEQRITEYKESLGDALPLISPVLIKKAIEGDIQAIKEINAVVVEKSSTKIEVNVKGAIAHGHFYPEDDQVEKDMNAKYKENMRARIKVLPEEKK